MRHPISYDGTLQVGIIRIDMEVFEEERSSDQTAKYALVISEQWEGKGRA